MTRHLSQIRSRPARSRIQSRKNGFSKIHRKRTISITKRKIIRAIHDRDGFGVIHCRSSGSGEGEEFSKSCGAFGGFGEVENGWVEAGSAEEADLGRDGAGGDEVVGWDGGEAVGGVVGGEGEVEGEEEGGDGGAVSGETGEDCGVKIRRVLGGNGLGNDAAKGVSYANHFRKVTKLSRSQHLDELMGNLDFQRSLDDIESIGRVGLSNPQTIVEESGVVVLSSNIHPTVSRSKVPIVSIKPNTMRQDLHLIRLGVIGRRAERSSNLVRAIDRLHAAHNVLHKR